MDFKAYQSSQEEKTLLSFLVHKIHMAAESQIFVNLGTQILKIIDYFNFLIVYRDWSCFLSAFSPSKD